MANTLSWQRTLFETVCSQLDQNDNYHLNWVADLRDIEQAEYSKNFLIEYFKCVFGEDQVAVYKNERTCDIFKDLEARDYPRVVVFDYFFCAESKLNYSAPEHIKDGWFNDYRWHGKKYWINNGKIIVVIMSNFLPDVEKYSKAKLLLTEVR